MWNRVKELVWRDFDIYVIHDDKYLTNKIKSYGNEIKTDCHSDRLPPKKAWCLGNSIKPIDSVHRTSKLCHPQVLFDECEYVTKDKLIKRFEFQIYVWKFLSF